MAEQGDSPLRGSGFNTDPQTGDWDQLSFQNHNLNEYVRGENTDTDDAFAVYVQGVNTTTKVFNILKTGAIWAGSQNSAVLGSSPNITFGTAVAGGSAPFALRQDATLLLYDGTLPAAETFGSVGTTGSSSLAPRRDHVHPMPNAPVTSISASGAALLTGTVNLYSGSGIILTQTAQGIQITASAAVAAGASAGLPALIWGTTNVAGAAGTFVDAASTLKIYDTTAPSTWAFGTAVAVGAGSFAARSNHVHAVPSMAAPALVMGTVAAAGVSGVPFPLDSTFAAFDSSVPVTQAFADAAATGVVNFAARRDHKHGIMALSAITSTGTLLANLIFTDNTYDIGASGATRPRVGYFSSALVVGTNPSTTGAIRLANADKIITRNAANNADYDLIFRDASNQVTIGGTTGTVQMWNASLAALSSMLSRTADGSGHMPASQPYWCLA